MMDVVIAQVDIALFIRRELTEQVATFTWQKPENGTAMLDLSGGDRIVSIPVSLLELQDYDYVETKERIRNEIRKAVDGWQSTVRRPLSITTRQFWTIRILKTGRQLLFYRMNREIMGWISKQSRDSE